MARRKNGFWFALQTSLDASNAPQVAPHVSMSEWRVDIRGGAIRTGRPPNSHAINSVGRDSQRKSLASGAAGNLVQSLLFTTFMEDLADGSRTHDENKRILRYFNAFPTRDTDVRS